eukprot:138123-Pleurochrysis_carterae.AAC.2
MAKTKVRSLRAKRSRLHRRVCGERRLEDFVIRRGAAIGCRPSVDELFGDIFSRSCVPRLCERGLARALARLERLHERAHVRSAWEIGERRARRAARHLTPRE